MLPVAAGSLAAAAATPPDTINIPGEKIFPESLTSTADGSIIIGSIAQKQVYRVKPGAATAEVWIAPGTEGLNNVLGVFADNKAGTLYVCSNVLGPPGANFGNDHQSIRIGMHRPFDDLVGHMRSIKIARIDVVDPRRNSLSQNSYCNIHITRWSVHLRAGKLHGAIAHSLQTC